MSGNTGDASIAVSPVHIDFRGAVQVAGTSLSACGRLLDGRVLCTGNYVGDRRFDGRATREWVEAVGVRDAVNGPLGFTCAVRVNGRVACWGPPNTVGLPASSEPVDLEGIENAASIEMYFDICAVSRIGELRCIGNEWPGSLDGDGGYSWTLVPGVRDVVQVQPGETTCVLEANGKVYCWGKNEFGQVGNGTITPAPGLQREPAEVVGVDDVEEIAGNFEFRCARTRDGRVYCWGANGNLHLFGDDNTELARPTPVLIDGP